MHWDRADAPLTEFVAALVRLRREHPTFRRARFFDGRPVRRGEGEPLPDIVWLTPGGVEMAPEDWDSGFGRSIGVFLNGNGIRGRDARGERIVDKNFIVYFNAHDDIVEFQLPHDEYAGQWETVVDTAGAGADSAPLDAGAVIPIGAKSLVVLRAFTTPEVEPDHSVAASLASLATSSIPVINASSGTKVS